MHPPPDIFIRAKDLRHETVGKFQRKPRPRQHKKTERQNKMLPPLRAVHPLHRPVLPPRPRRRLAREDQRVVRRHQSDHRKNHPQKILRTHQLIFLAEFRARLRRRQVHMHAPPARNFHSPPDGTSRTSPPGSPCESSKPDPTTAESCGCHGSSRNSPPPSNRFAPPIMVAFEERLHPVAGILNFVFNAPTHGICCKSPARSATARRSSAR